MKQLILSLLTVFFVSVSFCQDTILVHKVNSTSKDYRLIDIADFENNRLYLFIMSQFAFDCYEIDLETNKVIAELSSSRQDEKEFETFVFGSVKDRTVRLYFHANGEERFKIVRAHFNTRTLDINTAEIDTRDPVIGRFFYGDTLYSLKLQPKSSVFTLHRLEDDAFRKSTLDFLQTTYSSLEKKPISELLTDKIPWYVKSMRLDLLFRKPTASVSYVATEAGTTLVEAASLKKVYLDEEYHVIITLDDKDYTRIWRIEPSANKIAYKRVDKTFSQLDPYCKICSNSYLYGNWLFQVNSAEQGITIRVYDILKDTTLAIYRVGSGPGTDLTVNNMRGKVVKQALISMDVSPEPKEKTYKTKEEFLKNIYPNYVAIAITGQTSTHFDLRVGAFKKADEFYLDAVIERTNMPKILKPEEPPIEEQMEMFKKLSAAIEQHTATNPGEAKDKGNISILKGNAIYSYYDRKNKQLGLIRFNIKEITQ